MDGLAATRSQFAVVDQKLVMFHLSFFYDLRHSSRLELTTSSAIADILRPAPFRLKFLLVTLILYVDFM